MICIVLQETSRYDLVYEAYIAGISYLIAILVFIVLCGSSWVYASRIRRRIRRDLGGAYSGDLACIGTWMKVDEAEERARTGPKREWVPKSTASGFSMSGAYCVVRPFVATEPISGRRYRFVSGMVVIADLTQDTPNVTIEADASYFVVDFLTFSNCCKHPTEGP